MNVLSRRVSFTVIFICASFLSFAQSTFVTPEISVFYGYGFATKIRTYDGYLRVKDAPTYGASIAIPLPIRGNGFQLEALYQRQDTKIESHLGGIAYYPQLDNGGINWNVSASYIQLGGVQNVIASEDQKVVPFLGLSLGALWFENHEAGYEDTWKFAWGLKGGAKVRINDKIGFKGTASLYSPVQSGGLYLGVGSGGVSTGVSTSSSIYQFSINGGLVYYISKQ